MDRSDWTGVRQTDVHAKPIGWVRPLPGQRVVYVSDARIRRAKVSGYFILAPGAQPRPTSKGRLCVEVECYWYGRKPATSWLHLTVDGHYLEVFARRSAVIYDLGRPSEVLRGAPGRVGGVTEVVATTRAPSCVAAAADATQGPEQAKFQTVTMES